MTRTTGRKTRHAERFAAHAAEVTDLEALLDFVKAYYDFDEIPYRSERIRTALRILLRDPSLGRVWIIRYGRKAVGHAILTFGYDLEFNGRQATITELFIAPAYRSRRLGSKMINLIEDTCRQLGIGALELQVERDNVRAQSLYRKLGFRTHDRIAMSKMLRAGRSRARSSQSPREQIRCCRWSTSARWCAALFTDWFRSAYEAGLKLPLVYVCSA
jgi:ribosomal protein S18 acetylase RimI-like enzyme